VARCWGFRESSDAVAEGHGVDPDIPVVDDPSQLAKGIDPQLETAVNAVLDELQTNPPVFADPPEFEVR
jgi:tricorn protease